MFVGRVRSKLVLTWHPLNFEFQVHVHTVYPAILSLNAWICFFAALQSSLIALFLSNNINVWRLEWNVQLLNIIYCVSSKNILKTYIAWVLLLGHVLIPASTPDKIYIMYRYAYLFIKFQNLVLFLSSYPNPHSYLSMCNLVQNCQIKLISAVYVALNLNTNINREL